MIIVLSINGIIVLYCSCHSYKDSVLMPYHFRVDYMDSSLFVCPFLLKK